MRQFSDPFSTQDYAWCVANNLQHLIPDELHESCVEINTQAEANAVLNGAQAQAVKMSAPILTVVKDAKPGESGSTGTLEGEGETEPDEYNEYTMDELKDELEARSLPKSGKKQELIDRLRADDKKG